MPPSASRRFVPGTVPGFPLGLMALVLALLPAAVRADADVFGLGNGQHGALDVVEAGVVINASTPLTAEAPAGATELGVADESAFAPGELVLVLQVGDELPLDEYRKGGDTLDVQDWGAGRWELARLLGVAPGVLRLEAPLLRRFALVSQVVRVPEFTEVRISERGSLRARPWNGRSGGVLAFLATGTVYNQGGLSAKGAGYRGGEAESGVATALYGCAQEDGDAPSGGGASKGEGLASGLSGAPTHGYGRLANAGGGGNCHDSGGGGGGHVGRGGKGGMSSQETVRDVGGRGGMPLRYSSPRERLLFGGGGGAGIEGSSGGAGGGILFVRARSLLGSGEGSTLTASGQDAPSAVSIHGGGGGGGAGGTVHVRIAEGLGCTSLQARGGVGASSDISPGGGGGGGSLFVQAAGGVPTSLCKASAGAGLAGYSPTGTRGAEPISEGDSNFDGSVSVITEGFSVPPVPTWVSPGAGAADVEPLPRLEGKTAPGATVQVLLDGAPLGAPVVADASGGFAVVPSTELASGAHEARAWAELLGARSATSAPLGFTVSDGSSAGGDGEVDEGLALRVGFGCGVASGRGAWGLGLAVLALALGRRRGWA
ncbi:hemagglutinin [Vitiosangium sp. GDMCC 1.1324]|uniref:adventurous gliding motility protein AgmC n=1 Tax=Vitiosangium sp. (strain GDMCC 1.1324) TaxID=2138576 RepID=UPI000D39D831|nr:hemagglutinin [Vitiosangium sp. GDMCC 1.1324]PTL76674.1 hemagglutinin [Vitiosangium sp. GDMCC 1.1324]